MANIIKKTYMNVSIDCTCSYQSYCVLLTMHLMFLMKQLIHRLHNNNLHNRAILALLSKYAECLSIYFMALKLKYII